MALPCCRTPSYKGLAGRESPRPAIHQYRQTPPFFAAVAPHWHQGNSYYLQHRLYFSKLQPARRRLKSADVREFA